ncbi:hypothetical protein BSKO_07312 [Bryopsis sp. KO-2023]|nr:hypothetical protein BSKO_07312 [Bryopsis sp. KO-2023]
MPFLFFRRPTESLENRVVEFGLSKGFNHKHPGKTRGAPPLPPPLNGWGWHEVQKSIQVGSGSSTYESAKKALKRWGHFQLGWTYVRPTAEVAEGGGVCVVAKPLLMWVANPLKILYVEEKGAETDQKKSFSFGASTLKGHLLAGEERFKVKMKKDDSVWYEIYSFSRPSHLLSMISYPVVRYLQYRFAIDSMRSMAKAAQND